MSFELDINAFCEKVKGNADKVVRATVISMARSIMERSPIGNPSLWMHPAPPGYVGGTFRANWQLGVNEAPKEEIQGTDAEGERTLRKIMSGIPKEAAGNIFYLVNNLPYAWPIENGHSTKQAPKALLALR